jgi:hypothetical protein
MQGKEKNVHDIAKDIRDVCSSSTAGKKRSNYQQQKIVHSAMGLIVIATHPKEFALMSEDLQPEITVNSTINGSESTIGWGAKQASTIGWGGKAGIHDWLGAE